MLFENFAPCITGIMCTQYCYEQATGKSICFLNSFRHQLLSHHTCVCKGQYTEPLMPWTCYRQAHQLENTHKMCFFIVFKKNTVSCTLVCTGENGCKRRGKEWCSSSVHCSTDHRGWPFLLLQLQAQSSPTLCKRVIHQFVPSGAMLST